MQPKRMGVFEGQMWNSFIAVKEVTKWIVKRGGSKRS